jgi:hypothetical protein
MKIRRVMFIKVRVGAISFTDPNETVDPVGIAST